ncbi:fluoride efflux transporter CrcB [Bacillus sp. UMB0728]|uniref:fluoride efflux transporter CrcB n=1 Tax=Bacillus sp. UMB0728 TaxID=2066052 RepID=UPI000C76F804|nr:fluoride efflux transporter CrcB [Bacillus sp. UMB0728]PLR70298.1 fluoride efflux transporter CrcB [Bacillus sp. UMB0728]
MIWLIGVGGSLGAATRFLLGKFINKKVQRFSLFPTGTWVINITGSFLLGFIANLHLTHQIHDSLWFLLGVGFCGAYTTFSTFGYETITLIGSGKIKIAIIYVTTSVFLGGISATIGLII